MRAPSLQRAHIVQWIETGAGKEDSGLLSVPGQYQLSKSMTTCSMSTVPKYPSIDGKDSCGLSLTSPSWGLKKKNPKVSKVSSCTHCLLAPGPKHAWRPQNHRVQAMCHWKFSPAPGMWLFTVSDQSPSHTCSWGFVLMGIRWIFNPKACKISTLIRHLHSMVLMKKNAFHGH